MLTTRANLEAVLRRNDYKNKGDEWTGRRFWAGGDNPTAVNVKFTDDEHGVFTVFTGNGERGSLYEFCELINMPDLIATRKDTPVQAEPTKRGYRDLKEYAILHGLDDEQPFVEAMWQEVELHNRPALKFPTATGARYRFIDGNDPRFWHASGYQRCWYGLDRAVKRAKDSGHPLVLTNGEPSVVVAVHYGVAACCVTSSGEKEIPPALLDELKKKWRGPIVIAMDSDKTGREAAAKLYGQLSDYEIAVFENGIEGGDLADFCKLHRNNTLLEMASRLPEPRKPDLPDVLKPQLQELSASVTALSKAVNNADKAASQRDIDRQLVETQALINRISMDVKEPIIIDNQDLIDSAINEIESGTGDTGFMSGLRLLDKATDGFMLGEVVSFYGAAGMGKSTLLSSIAYHLLNQAPGIIASTELTPKQWLYKIVAYATGIPAGKIVKSKTDDNEKKRVLDALRFMRASDRIKWLDSAMPTTVELTAAVDKALAEGDYKWLIVDSASDIKGSGENLAQQLGNAFHDLHELCRSRYIAGVVSIHVGRDVSQRPAGKKRPVLTDAFGSSIVEKKSAAVFGLYNHHYYVLEGLEEPDPDLPEGVVEILNNKSRWGEKGTYLKAAFKGGIGFYDFEDHFKTVNLGDV